MLKAWENKNYGELSKLLKIVFSYEKNLKIHPKLCREIFEEKELISFKLIDLEETNCCGLRIEILVIYRKLNQTYKDIIKLGSFYRDENERIVYPWNNNGEWLIFPHDISAFYK